MIVLSLFRGLIETDPKPLTMKAIAEEVCERYGLTLEELKGPGTYRRVARPRQEAYAIMYATGRYSYPQIGRFFGGRDHTAVYYGIRRHEGCARTYGPAKAAEQARAA